jgi:hypothetical protein
MYTDDEIRSMLRRKRVKRIGKTGYYHLRLLVQEHKALKPRRVEISLRTPHEAEAIHAARVLLSFLHVWGLTLTNLTSTEAKAEKKRKLPPQLPLFICAPTQQS